MEVIPTCRERLITDIRQGEGGPARLWYAYQARRLAAEEGRCVDDDIVRRARPPGDAPRLRPLAGVCLKGVAAAGRAQ